MKRYRDTFSNIQLNNDERKKLDWDKQRQEIIDVAVAVARSMIKTIKCKCGYENEAKDSYQVGIIKDCCTKCGEELPLEGIFGGIRKEFYKMVVEEKKEDVGNLKEDTPKEISDRIKKYVVSDKVKQEVKMFKNFDPFDSEESYVIDYSDIIYIFRCKKCGIMLEMTTSERDIASCCPACKSSPFETEAS